MSDPTVIKSGLPISMTGPMEVSENNFPKFIYKPENPAVHILWTKNLFVELIVNNDLAITLVKPIE